MKVYIFTSIFYKLEFPFRKEKELPLLPDFSLYNKTKTEYKINEAGSGYDGPVTCPYSNEWFYNSLPVENTVEYNPQGKHYRYSISKTE